MTKLYVECDPLFPQLVIGPTLLETLDSGCRRAEGPAYFPAGRYVLWSDFPNDPLLRSNKRK